MSRSLVTGGAGFVGKHLVKALLARGENVRVLDIKPFESGEYIRGSITDPDAVTQAVDGVDTVFHLAGNAQLWAPDARAFDKINHRGTLTVLAAAKAGGVRRFIHCSSLTTLVGVRTPIGPSAADESVVLPPGEMLGPYPRSKRLADLAVEEAVSAGLDAVIAIPTEPLGPGDDSLTPPTQLILDLVNKKIPAWIDCTLNFVPVESLAEGIIAARDRGRRGGRYLLGGENVPMARLLDCVGRLTGRKMPMHRLPYLVAYLAGVVDTQFIARAARRAPKAPLTGVRLAGRRVSFSSEKAKRELDWTAAPFEPSLDATLKWLTDCGFAARF